MDHFPLLFQQIILSLSANIGTSPTAHSFLTMVMGWSLCTGRHTISGIIRAAGPYAPKSHDAYQNFFSKSEWSFDDLWEALFLLLVKLFAVPSDPSDPSSPPVIYLAGDDTVSKHTGPKIWGAGLFRDAVRSSRRLVAYAWGLNWVVLAMIIKVPLLNDRYIAVPILPRLNPKTNDDDSQGPEDKAIRRKRKGRGSKDKKTTVTIMAEMLNTVVGWLPEAKYYFVGDGAYACLAGSLPQNVMLTSRIRRDAALYAPPPKRRKKKGRHGRHPKYGRRLPSPLNMAKTVGNRWKKCQLEIYGRTKRSLLYSYTAIWREVCPDRLINIVIVRDPTGEAEDEYFFTTDLDMSPEQIVLRYSVRWSIEVVFRETRQYLGRDHPQARKRTAVLRITPFCFFLNAIVKLWFILQAQQNSVTTPKTPPWYPHKDTISFQDMLGALRLHFWKSYIRANSTSQEDIENLIDFLGESIARVT